MSRLRTPFFAVALVLSVMLSACGRGGPADPSEAVADAWRRTFSQPFTFHVALESDEQGRSWMPSQAGMLLSTANIQGRKGEQGHEWALEVLGVKVFEQRQVGATSYVRLDVPTIAGAMGGNLDLEGLRREVAAGNPDPRASALVDQVLAGRWVGFEFGQQQGFPSLPFAFGLPSGDVGGKAKERLGPTLEDFLAKFVVVTEIPTEDGARHFALDLKARDIARAFADLMQEMAAGFGAHPHDQDTERDLAEVPERVSGVSVVVADRLVRKVEMDLTQVARAADEHAPDGRLALVADFAETDDFPLQAPEGALVVDQDELRTLMGTRSCPMCGAHAGEELGPAGGA